jgi:hypothetical protein
MASNAWAIVSAGRGLIHIESNRPMPAMSSARSAPSPEYQRDDVVPITRPL